MEGFSKHIKKPSHEDYNNQHQRTELMNDIEFLNYLPTPEEQYFMGIATVRLYGRIILKYKVIEKKDGSGFFVASPNYRLPLGENGDLKYVDAIMLDSRMEHDELMNIIRNGVNRSISPQPQQQYQPPPPQAENFQPDLNAFPF